MSEMNKILDAIRIVHKGKSETLNIEHYVHFSAWDQENDAGWQEYKRAREYISRHHKLIEKLLLWIDYI